MYTEGILGQVGVFFDLLLLLNLLPMSLKTIGVLTRDPRCRPSTRRTGNLTVDLSSSTTLRALAASSLAFSNTLSTIGCCRKDCVGATTRHKTNTYLSTPNAFPVQPLVPILTLLGILVYLWRLLLITASFIRMY